MVVVKFPEQIGLEIISDFAASASQSWLRDRGNIGPLYRGHADLTWTPIASAFRPGQSGIVERGDLSKWKATAQRFVSPRPADDLSYLVLAQHYGIPTALLDWTTNPLTALFFACVGVKSEADGTVLQIDSDEFDFMEYSGTVDPFGKARFRPYLIDTSAMNVRSTAQDSFMTLHEATDAPLPTRNIFRVEARHKWHVHKALALMGLTPERVYADLGVAAARFRDSLAINALVRIGLSPREQDR